MMTWGRIYWPYAILAVSLVFLIPEVIALITNRANTLSEYSWAELHVGRSYPPLHTLAWGLSLGMWLLFVAVITAHIWWRTIS